MPNSASLGCLTATFAKQEESASDGAEAAAEWYNESAAQDAAKDNIADSQQAEEEWREEAAAWTSAEAEGK